MIHQSSIRLTLIAGSPPRSVDVRVVAPRGATFGESVEALTQLMGEGSWYASGRPVPGEAAWGEPPLVPGAVLTQNRPAATRSAGSLLRLECIEGHDAGRVFDLRPGCTEIGRAAGAGIRLSDPGLSRVHARLDVGSHGVLVHDAASTNGSAVEGEPVGRGRALPLGGRLRLASTTLLLRAESDPLALSPAGVGDTDNSTPDEFRLPAPDAPPPSPGSPVLLLVLPMVVSAAMALALHSVLYLAFGVGAAVVAAAHSLTARRQWRRVLRGQADRHTLACSRVLDEVTRARHAELRRLREQNPDPVRLLAIAEKREPPLRRTDCPLRLRIGVGSVVSAVQILDAERRCVDAPVLAEAPVSIALPGLRRLCVHGDRERALALLRQLVAQLCMKVPDARIGLASAHPDDWEWLGWLPQCRPYASRLALPDPAAAGTGSAARLVARAIRMAAGLTAETPAGCDAGPAAPRTVLIWDLPDPCPTAVPGMTQLVVGEQPDPLADSHIQISSEGTVTLGTLPGQVGSPTGTVTADLPGHWWAQRLARALAGAAGPDTDGPVEYGLADLLGVDPTDPRQVLRRWRTPTTRVVLGSRGDTPVDIDLVADGPHLLVAGATGSGKSEFLRSLVMALAVSNPPDRLGFVLIDYKGGAAFAKIAGLPHTTGVVTDLDGQLTRRALLGLGVEVRRRESLLRRAEVDDLAAYQSRPRAGLPTLARLVIVIDEFRVLAEELPDFVAGLVRLASVGRSLGIHLVLATQRPGGVIGPDIRANVPLRLAFRVTDEIESRDVVGTVLAAALPADRPGTAVLRRGDETPVVARFARVEVPPTTNQVTITTSPFRRLGEGSAVTGSEGPAAGEQNRDATPGATVLEQLVRVAADAAEAIGAVRPHGPWLPPLPPAVRLTELGRPAPGRLRIGLVDLPHEQRRAGLDWDPTTTVLAAVGTDERGAATLVGCLIHGLVETGAAVHLFDGTGGLVDPRVGPDPAQLVARVCPDDLDHAGRVLEAVQRTILDGGTITPALVVHAWDELSEAWSGEPTLTEHLVRIVRRGRRRGLAVAFTGGRGLLSGPLAGLIDERLVLSHREPTDAVLAGAPRTLVPDPWPPGRAVWVAAAGAAHVQLAQAPSTAEHGAAEPPAEVIPATPSRVRLVDLGTPRPAWLPMGVGGTHLRPVGWPTDRFLSLLVAGPARSGRSSCLLALADSARRLGWTVSVRCLPSSPLAVLPQPAGQVTPTRELLLIDDLECLDPATLGTALAEAERAGTVVAAAVAISDLAVRPAARSLARAGHGLLLGPRRGHEGEAFGVRVGASQTGHPGRGLLLQAGAVIRVQLGVVDFPSRDPPRVGLSVSANASRNAPKPVTTQTSSTGAAITQRPAWANGRPTAKAINICTVRIGTLAQRAARDQPRANQSNVARTTARYSNTPRPCRRSPAESVSSPTLATAIITVTAVASTSRPTMVSRWVEVRVTAAVRVTRSEESRAGRGAVTGEGYPLGPRAPGNRAVLR